jgi:hypothetical protein
VITDDPVKFSLYAQSVSSIANSISGEAKKLVGVVRKMSPHTNLIAISVNNFRSLVDLMQIISFFWWDSAAVNDGRLYENTQLQLKDRQQQARAGDPAHGVTR